MINGAQLIDATVHSEKFAQLTLALVWNASALSADVGLYQASATGVDGQAFLVHAQDSDQMGGDLNMRAGDGVSGGSIGLRAGIASGGSSGNAFLSAGGASGTDISVFINGDARTLTLAGVSTSALTTQLVIDGSENSLIVTSSTNSVGTGGQIALIAQDSAVSDGGFATIVGGAGNSEGSTGGSAGLTGGSGDTGGRAGVFGGAGTTVGGIAQLTSGDGATAGAVEILVGISSAADGAHLRLTGGGSATGNAGAMLFQGGTGLNAGGGFAFTGGNSFTAGVGGGFSVTTGGGGTGGSLTLDVGAGASVAGDMSAIVRGNSTAVGGSMRLEVERSMGGNGQMSLIAPALVATISQDGSTFSTMTIDGGGFALSSSASTFTVGSFYVNSGSTVGFTASGSFSVSGGSDMTLQTSAGYVSVYGSTGQSLRFDDAGNVTAQSASAMTLNGATGMTLNAFTGSMGFNTNSGGFDFESSGGAFYTNTDGGFSLNTIASGSISASGPLAMSGSGISVNAVSDNCNIAGALGGSLFIDTAGNASLIGGDGNGHAGRAIVAAADGVAYGSTLTLDGRAFQVSTLSVAGDLQIVAVGLLQVADGPGSGLYTNGAGTLTLSAAQNVNVTSSLGYAVTLADGSGSTAQLDGNGSIFLSSANDSQFIVQGELDLLSTNSLFLRGRDVQIVTANDPTITGPITIATGSGDADVGAITISVGISQNNTPGLLSILGGYSNGSAKAGSVLIEGGNGDGEGAGGDITLRTYLGGKLIANVQSFGIFGATPVAQQSVSALTNNITPGGTANTLTNYTNLTVYATDAAAIRNNLYQLGLEVSTLRNAMAALGWVA